MKRTSVLLFVVLAAICAAQTLEEIAENELCGGMIPDECPDSISPDVTEEACLTCCCASSSNVKFYRLSEGEPNCEAPPAVYEAKFVASWTGTCHPDYYFNDSIWSPLTGISHKPEYELWEACMRNVSEGVALVSQTGNTTVINMEYVANNVSVLDTFTADGPLLSGAGTITGELDFNRDHQYVSLVIMLVPSVDRMMGVSSLQLCDGSEWKESVKICGELFSTATKSERVSDDRNSIQYNNCSFGYFEFTLLSTSPVQTELPTSAGQMVLPRVGFIVLLLALLQLFLRYLPLM